MDKFWVITKEVYKKNVKSIGFLIMVLAPVLVAVVGIAVGYFISEDQKNAEPAPIAVISESSTIQEMLSQENEMYDVQDDIVTENAAEEALLDESIDGYLIISENAGVIKAEAVHTDSLTNVLPVLNEQLSNYQTLLRAGELNLSQEQVMSLSEPVMIEESIVNIEDGNLNEEENTDTFVQEFGAYFVSIAIFGFIMSYASIIAEEVASEKGTRIMEIILSSATATNHFFGKLAGVMLVLMTQITFYLIIGGAAYFIAKDMSFLQELTAGIDIWSVIQGLMGYTIVFFITGVLMYIILAAFLGSLASKMEDVNKAVTPIVFLALIGFYVGMFAFAAPENIVPVIFSYIPIFTPFVMPFRIASETVDTLGIWLSIFGTIAFTALLTYLSLIFYRANVLIYSDGGIIKSMKRSWGVLKSNRNAKKMNVNE
ncbi:ABC transporter permease [Marinilactibacillus psychrotolerans]|uniref:ABC transporter permease protein n=1 Tax=Marinilactibacillus psychrotolerans TaxID=191770 RepID=A0AAV3X015_9LACT|nr:ABC transporter permease [Marinilactibacillus psychrotolerans]GEL67670.1 sodium ABC transporter permease [Marinilactibacillus psychrotolerans]GEQ36539.1 ABC transporter permease protein [Marinilactibacillus psychrotolerans]SDD14409.1 ABC-2 type transport system permease protein [Marinilactibacillus psychrotolerans]